MNIEFDTYKQKLNDCRPALDGLAESLNMTGMRNELERLHAMQEAPGFWDDPEKSQKVAIKVKQTEAKIERYEKMVASWDDMMTICEMAAEEDDDSMLDELKQSFEVLEEQMETCRLETLLTGHYDKNNALMSFHAGAGGTEAQDWASMLERMYLKYTESKGFSVKLTSETAGDVAGIKNCSIYIQGDWAYGTLRTETGIHRLVRKSPFDSNARRHTSFASVYVYPEVDDSIEIEINPADLRIDVYRASGAGGQHVQKTESAVRITHIPTGIVTECQDERSQHQNKDRAMQQLRAKLYEFEMNKRRAEQQKLEDAKDDIGWGHQIRSYVLDQSRIKDLRTNVENTNTTAVLNGDLDQFIEASLKQGV